MSHSSRHVARIGRGRRVLTRLAAVVPVALGATLVAGATARATLRHSNPPPGRLVAVHGRQMHILCTGQGDPTVVLDAGLTDFSVLWSSVQAGASTFARTCSYDRAGMGWSDPGAGPRTSAVAVADLEELLVSAGIEPPFVLVGHSYGGLNLRRYARQHPAQVAGLVLVDAAHEDMFRRVRGLRSARDASTRQFRMLARLNAIGLLALMPGRIPDRGLEPEAARRYRRVLAASGYFHGALAEVASLDASFAPDSADHAPLGDLPIVVIRRGRPDSVAGLGDSANAALEVEWARMQDDLLALSSDATAVVAEASSHDVHVQQPDRVVHAIRTLVDRARKQPRPSS